MTDTIKTKAFAFLLIVIFVLANTTNLFCQTDKEVEKVLYAAEFLFKSMKVRDYKTVWNSITKRSKERIVDDVYKELTKKDDKYSKEQVSDDFGNCNVICSTYWKGFLESFDPNSVLEHSRWGIGFIKRNEAEVVLHYKKSDQPARLKMFRENNEWRVGLTETFWSRK